MFTKNDKILIVGGSGFIGGHLAKKCLESTPFVNCLQADVKSVKELKKTLSGKKFDYVFNLSGYIDHTPYLKGGRKVIESHFTGLMNLVDCLDRSKLKSFVTVGSSDEYGGAKAPQKESMRESPVSPYAFSKTASAHFIKMLYDSEGFPGVVLRLFLVYGPGQDSGRFLPQIIKACLEDRAFKTSRGVQLRDFCYIDDVVEAMMKAAMSKTAKGRVINVASGKPVLIKDVVKKTMAFTGGGRPVFGAHPYKKNENMRLYADIALAGKILGWSPRTSLDDGLKKTIEYYRDKP